MGACSDQPLTLGGREFAYRGPQALPEYEKNIKNSSRLLKFLNFSKDYFITGNRHFIFQILITSGRSMLRPTFNVMGGGHHYTIT